MRSFLLVTSLLSCLSACLCVDIAGSLLIRGFKITANRSDIRVTLNAGERVAFLDSENYFFFSNVHPGNYVLEVASPVHVYNTLRIVVENDSYTARIANFLASPDTGLELLQPLHLRPIDKIKFFQERQQWTPMDLVKNPMLLMLLVTGFMGFGLPKIMENVDPEMYEDMKDVQSGKKKLLDLLKDEDEVPTQEIKAKKTKAGVEKRRK